MISKYILKNIKNSEGNELDILVAEGTIVEISGKLDYMDIQEYDMSGKYYTAAFTDIHCHVVPGIIPLGLYPDEAGVNAGATTVCDAGSLGWNNFHEGRKILEENNSTDVLHFLHIAPEGEATLPETGYERYDKAKMDYVIKENRDSIIGVKARAVENALCFGGTDVFKEAADIAHENGIPLMVHLGDRNHREIDDNGMYAKTEEIISYMERGDILTHVFTPAPGGLVRDGKLIDAVDKVLNKGILLDLAPGMGHMSLTNLKTALDQGIVPDLAGTDAIKLPPERAFMSPHFYNLAIIASKLIASGIVMEEALQIISSNSDGITGRKSKIEIGAEANMRIYELIEGPSIFHDGGAGNMIQGNKLISPVMTIRNGIMHHVREDYKNHRVDPVTFKKIMEKTGNG